MPWETSPSSGLVERKMGGGNSGVQMVGQVEIHVKTLQGTLLQPFYFLDLVFRKHLAACFVLGVRQGQKALGKDAFSLISYGFILAN